MKTKTEPTEKQRDARWRNWTIRQLRALAHLCPPGMSQAGKDKVLAVVDEELARLGAELESVRIKRVWEELRDAEAAAAEDEGHRDSRES